MGMSRNRAILALGIMDAMILVSGVFYSVYSFRTGAMLQVLGSRIPGYVFGLVVIFLGVRYLKALLGLKKKISGPDARFDWNNFKKIKTGG